MSTIRLRDFVFAFCIAIATGFAVGLLVNDRDFSSVMGYEHLGLNLNPTAKVSFTGDNESLYDKPEKSVSIEDPDLVMGAALTLSTSMGAPIIADIPELPKTCGKCGKNMIRRYTGQMLTSYPPQEPWVWWCACGEQNPGGITVGKTEDQLARDAWDAAQVSDGKP